MINLLREKGTSVLSWLILIVLGLAFALTFGLPSDSISLGPESIASVHGNEIKREDFQYQAAAIARITRIPEDPKWRELYGVNEEVLEASIERLVLQDVGEDIGLATQPRDAEEMTFNGHIIILGDTADWLGDTEFNYDTIFKNWTGSLQVSEARYLEIQREEIMARTVRDLIATTTAIPESEIRAEYDKRERQLGLRFVRFETEHYAQLIDPTPEEVDAYMTKESTALAERYEAQAARFLKLPAQVRLRILEVRRPAPLPEDASDESQKERAAADKDARARAVAARKRVLGGEAFSAVARELSEHDPTRMAGGDLGWVMTEGTGSGLDSAIDEAANALAAAEVSDVIETEAAYTLLWVDAKRDAGDVPEADALKELAWESVREEKGRAQAKQAAEEALLAVRENGSSLDELFADNASAGGIDSLPIGGDPELGGPVDPSRRAPKVQETGLFSPDRDTIPGLGAQPALLEAAKAEAAGDSVINQVFDAPGGFLVAGVAEKMEPTDEGFAEAREGIYAEMAQQKSGKLTAEFAQRRCLEGRGRGDVQGNDKQIKRLTTYEGNNSVDEDGNLLKRPYSMCDRVGNRGGMLKLQAMLGGARQ